MGSHTAKRKENKMITFKTGELLLREHTSLSEGQTITVTTGGSTEEGYFSSTVRFSLDEENGVLSKEEMTDSRDCDGRFTTETHYLYDEKSEEWERVNSSQRDYEAERMGY
jgi:hypothetical protein